MFQGGVTHLTLTGGSRPRLSVRLLQNAALCGRAYMLPRPCWGPQSPAFWSQLSPWPSSRCLSSSVAFSQSMIWFSLLQWSVLANLWCSCCAFFIACLIVVSFSHSFWCPFFFLAINLLPVSRVYVSLRDWHGISYTTLHLLRCILSLGWTSLFQSVVCGLPGVLMLCFLEVLLMRSWETYCFLYARNSNYQRAAKPCPVVQLPSHCLLHRLTVLLEDVVKQVFELKSWTVRLENKSAL